MGPQGKRREPACGWAASLRLLLLLLPLVVQRRIHHAVHATVQVSCSASCSASIVQWWLQCKYRAVLMTV